LRAHTSTKERRLGGIVEKMPYNDGATASDFEKLHLAWQQVTSKFGSVEDVLQALGLADMPAAQRYGILFGFIVFSLTIASVLALLTLGGSFRRIAEQAETGQSTLLTATEARQQRSLLLEQLLEGRERMQRNYPPPPPLTEQPTPLTLMLLNQAPDPVDDSATTADTNENSNDLNLQTESKTQNSNVNKERYIPPFYQENYTNAYRKCQDRPGGEWIPLIL
jgi:hypothetical protein